ncbi:hypothetical protein EII29_01285 [Leptotrichia sp. OH3620_COT-345]|uniref:S26 family signal peptidase n=1 Tax=Leptotrichia sp. OH3620_COT-345 TaxID=2491048 RepID=UPI000F6557F8|nr:S26 family signal peptidase [Leptotrichia sp. OH3620_COT-345]RRD40604.1 hypothetical protein EII29_01285 [Leptotrichia sp. OH3620_COT-345]
MNILNISKGKITEILKIMKKHKFTTKLVTLFFIFFSITFCLSRITYNVTDSLTKGVYLKKFFPDYRKGNLVLFIMDKKYSKYIENFPNKDKMKNIYLLKRIVAVEGDIIEIKNDGMLFINSEKKGKILKIKGITDTIENTKYILKKDEYYLMGDTETSFDSRYLGILNKRDFKYEMKLLIKEEILEKFINKVAKGKKA